VAGQNGGGIRRNPAEPAGKLTGGKNSFLPPAEQPSGRNQGRSYNPWFEWNIFGEKILLRNTIPALVAALINIAWPSSFLNISGLLLMKFFCRPDEIIIGNIELLPQVLNRMTTLSASSWGDSPFSAALFLYFLPVFISAGQEKDLFPGQPLITGQSIGYNSCISMTDMGNIVHIIDIVVT
jgi:hypothetical protein